MGLINSTQQYYYNSESEFGNYQFVSLHDIISQFMFVYVGEDKIISKASRVDVAFHAQRALAELSFDTLKSFKSQEITVPATLQMTLPHDYVNYTKISHVDSAGIKHVLYPTSKTSNPTRYQQDSDGDFLFNDTRLISSGELIKNGDFNGGTTGWVLNSDGMGQEEPDAGSQVVITTTNNLGVKEPSQGWFYGFDGNAVRGYNLLQYQAFRQEGIPILPGEQYKIKYTVSNYSSGSFNFVISNNLAGITQGTVNTGNGTYEETVTAISTGNFGTSDWIPNQLWFRNMSTDAGNFTIDSISIVRVGDEESSTTWGNYKSNTPSENNNDDYEDDTYWPAHGERYGLDPQHAQANGSFYIDQLSGKIHFSSNISGKTVILDYISDSLGTDNEMQVHKFAEEAMYRWIAHAVLAGKSNIPEYQVNRFKKEKFAAVRTAKLRLSNLKLEELTQVLRGKSKQIKH